MDPVRKEGNAVDGGWTIDVIKIDLNVDRILTGVSISSSGLHAPLICQVEIEIEDIQISIIEDETIVNRSGSKTFHPFWIGNIPLTPAFKAALVVHVGNFTGADVKVFANLFTEKLIDTGVNI